MHFSSAFTRENTSSLPVPDQSSMDQRENNNNNGRNGSFLRGWLPHRGKAQMACNYCFPTRTMF